MFAWLTGKKVPKKFTFPVLWWGNHPKYGRLAVLAETFDVSKKWLMATAVDEDGDIVHIWSKDLRRIDPKTGEATDVTAAAEHAA
jgi:hypothetical protein